MSKKAYVLSIMLFLYFVFISAHASDLVITRVSGKDIIYQQIEVKPIDAIKLFKNNNNREPSEEELAAFIKKKEKSKLITQIDEIVKENTIKELNIEISDFELDKEYSKIYGRYFTQEEVDSEREILTNIIKSLRENIEHPDKEKEIYDRNLKGLVPYETWVGYKNKYKTENKISGLTKIIPKNIDDLKKMNDMKKKC